MTDEFKHAYAPFTDDEVLSLNAYQKSGVFHEFTCAGTRHEHSVPLVAFPAGWVCPDCDYTQTWAWRWMADWAWQELWSAVDE